MTNQQKSLLIVEAKINLLALHNDAVISEQALKDIYAVLNSELLKLK